MLLKRLYALLKETREYATKHRYYRFGENNEYRIEATFLIGCVAEQIEELDDKKNGINHKREET